MDHNDRDLLNHLGSKLAGLLEEVSGTAALLPSVPPEDCRAAMAKLHEATTSAQAIISAMTALLTR